MDTKKIPLQTIVQTGHSDQILCVAISPDGLYLASGSGGDSAVKLWDLQTGTLIRNFVGHAGWVTSVAFSSDGKYLVSGAWDSNVILWDVLTGEKLNEQLMEYANAVCFTPDNKGIIMAGGEGKGIAYLCDPVTDEIKQSFKGHTEEIIAVSLSSNGKWLVTGSKDGTAKLWDVETGNLLNTFTHSTRVFVHAVAIDPAADPQYIITAGSAEMHTVNAEAGKPQSLKMWDINDQKPKKALHEFTGHANNIYAVAISPNGRYLASASEDTTVCLWDLQSKEENRLLYQLKGHKKAVQAVCFSADGRYIASGGVDEEVKLWDVEAKEEIRTFSGNTAIVYAAAMTPNGKFIIEGGEGNKIHIWDLSKNKGYESLYKEQVQEKPLAEVKAIDISADGKLLAVGSNEGSDGYIGSIRIWDLEQNRHFKDCNCDQAVSSVRFSEDGKWLAAGCDLGNFCYWDLAKEKPVWMKKDLSVWGTYVDIDLEKGLLVAAFDHDKADKPDLIALDLNNNKRYILSYTWEKPFKRERIRSIRISKNGRWLVSAHHDRKIRLWDLENLADIKCTREFTDPGHDWVSSVDISADARYILSSNYDNSARLWDVHSKSKKPVQIFSGHTSELFARFSPDEKFIITASKDGTTKIWDLQSGKELAMLIGIGDADWAVIPPSGLFDASPGAMKKMHYISGMEVIELDQLKGRYWQPGLLAVLMNFEKGNLINVDELTQLALYPEVTSMDLDGGLLKVKLTERSGGIGRTSLRINNKEREQNINKEHKTEFSIDLKQYERFFAAGENSIAIRCWNKEDWLPGPLQQVKYDFKETGGTADPCLYGIFVGTSNYKNDRFSLTFPDQDAGYLSDAVKIVGEQFFKKGTGDVHIRLLTTEQPSSDTFSSKANIRAAFEEIAQKARPQDVVVFYFTGHGANYDNGQKALYYYLTHDIVSDNLSDDAVRNLVTISSEELCTWINKIPAMKQVLILDTCYSGKVVDSLKSKNALDGTRDREMERMKDRTGMYVLTGSAADKVSYEANNYGQGLLTYTLLMGMRGAALMKNSNQEISSVDVMKLFSWSREEVERLSKEFGVVQQPTLRAPDNVASFAIGLAPRNVMDKIKLAMPKPVFVHSNFMNSEDFLDELNISEMLDQYLMGSIGIGNRPQAIFIDVINFPGAHNVRGLYSKTTNGYELRGKVYKDRELKGSFEIEGQGMEDIVPKIAREVENYAFPMDGYKVPEDDEIGVLEKGLKDDLDKIVQKDLVDLMYGYKENFIGEKFKVPMPKLHAQHLQDVAYLLDPKTKSLTKDTELKYQYYSTVHNRKRKFPFFAACNLNGAAFLTAGRNGVFIADPRIAKEDQCGDELYTYKYKGKAYTEFCHRGHMAKREDPQWADKANLKTYYKSDKPADMSAAPEKRDKAVLTSIAERGARLTFFFTNAIPQHGHLNGVIWRGLEDYIMAVATNNKKAQGPDLYRVNIMTGPVFQDDDPVFPLNEEEKTKGKKNGLQVPTLFWKVVYFKKEDGKLYHIGFLMGQEELLKAEFEKLDGLKAKDIKAAVEKAIPPFEGYKNKAVFQVKVSFIETLTKLKFHPAVDPYNDSRPAKEIIEKVQLAKKDIGGIDDGPGYSLDGLSM